MGQKQYKPFVDEKKPDDQQNNPNKDEKHDKNQPIPLNPQPQGQIQQNPQPLNPFLNPYGYHENLGANYFMRNPSSERNRVFISRSCFGNYILKEYSPALTFNRVSQKEFEDEMGKINTLTWSFFWIKTLYVLMIILILISLLIFIFGITLNPDITNDYDKKYISSIIESQDAAYNVLTAGGMVLLILSVIIFIMAIVCTLKKYEFLIAKYLNESNKERFLTRNVFWKVGGFCRYIEINILPIQAEFIWFLQTHSGKDVEINNIKQILKF